MFSELTKSNMSGFQSVVIGENRNNPSMVMMEAMMSSALGDREQQFPSVSRLDSNDVKSAKHVLHWMTPPLPPHRHLNNQKSYTVDTASPYQHRVIWLTITCNYLTKWLEKSSLSLHGTLAYHLIIYHLVSQSCDRFWWQYKSPTKYPKHWFSIFISLFTAISQ